MKKIVFVVLLLLSFATSQAKLFQGIVVNNEGNPLEYPAIRTQLSQEGVLGDSLGRFKLNINRVYRNDSIVISYVGYKQSKISVIDIDSLRSDTIFLEPMPLELAEVCVLPEKLKKKVSGKKHSWAILKTTINGQIAGESYGYEFHAKKNKKLLLYKVGFFYCDGQNQMSRMKFRINVYDASGVTGSSTADFKPVLAKPIYFDFVLPEEGKSGKFEYYLPEAIVLPPDAMVEIEFVDNLNDEMFWFKSNVIGKSTWSKTVGEGFWCKTPFAGPFFVECIEEEISD